MKIINKKNSIFILSAIFTAATLFKVIYEAICMGEFGHYPLNILTIFLFSTFTTFILSQHHRIFHLPLFIAVLLQYLLVMLSMLLVVWVGGHFLELATHAYRDICVSISILYFMISIVYYIFFYINLKRHNLILQKLKQNKKSKVETND